MKKLITGPLLALTAVAFLSGPTVVSAGTASQGADTSNYLREADGDIREEVCDNEADGYGVHADFDFVYNNEQQRFDESGGADSACDRRGPGAAGLHGLDRHRTVEERPAWNELDVKGSWHNH